MYPFVVFVDGLPDGRGMLGVLILATGQFFQPQTGEVDLEEGGSCDLDVDVLEQSVDAGRVRHYSCVHRQIVLPPIDVVSHDLDGEVWNGQVAILRQEYSTDSLRLLVMAVLEGDVLLQSIQIAIDCSIVPASRNHKLHPCVDVVSGPE